jgi:multisubunit Na+/H+ antiporter MnhE subunit
MTTAVPSAAPQMSRVRYLALAVGASLVQMAMMIPGYSDDGSFQTTEWLTALAISLVVGLLLFAFAVPHGGAVTGILLGAVAVLSTLVFWAGVTLPLAAAAIVVGWRLRQSREHRTPAIVTLALGALAVVALVAIIIGDAIAN